MLQASPHTPLEAPTSNPTPTEVPAPLQEMEDCKEGIKDLRGDMEGLEFFLRDKKDHKKHCPDIKWKQPSLDEYKKDLKSHLPEGCKVEED
jgi:hypothetical protein